MEINGEILFSRIKSLEKEQLLKSGKDFSSVGLRATRRYHQNFYAISARADGTISSFATITEQYALSPRL